jgi:hypothetical protein
MSLYTQQSPFPMTPDEQISFVIDASPIATSPYTTLTFSLYDESNEDADVSSTKTSGSISASGDDITTKLVISLVKGNNYRGEVKFTDASSNVREFYIRIICR